MNDFKGAKILPANAKSIDRIFWLMHGCSQYPEDMLDAIAPALTRHAPRAALYAPAGALPSQNGGLQHFEIEKYYLRSQFTKASSQWTAEEASNMRALENGVEKHGRSLNTMLDKIASRHSVESKNIIMFGYSQGAQSVLHGGLRRIEQPGGLVSLFGSLLAPDRLATEIKNRPNTLLVASQSDTVLPAMATELARQTLEHSAVPVKLLSVETADHHRDWAETANHFVIPYMFQHLPALR